MKQYDKIVRRANDLKSSRKMLRSTLRSARSEYGSFRETLEADLEVQKIIQGLATTMQQRAHKQITAVVTRCLRAVYGGDLAFRINFERKRGKTQAVMVFVQNGVELDPQSAESGGVMEVAAFALRVSCLMLSTPKRRRLIVADEPFKSVHGSIYRERVVELIETLAEELNFQFILVSGLEWLRCGTTVQIGGSNDVL